MTHSVVILSRNPDNLIPCVRAAQANDPGEIVVVDDGAKDKASKVLSGITWVAGVKPFVYARNVNVGIAAAGNNDVVLLNDDALLLTEYGFTDMASIGEKDPRIGVLSSGIRGLVLCNPRQKARQPATLRQEHRILSFVCVYIPRRTINQVGLLDERFTGYGEEDRDYCIRVMQNGLVLAIWDGCVVDHQRLPSTFRTQPDWMEQYKHNQRLFRQKWS